MTEKTGETTSPDRLLRFNGVHGRAQDAKDRDEILRGGKPVSARSGVSFVSSGGKIAWKGNDHAMSIIQSEVRARNTR